MLNLTDLQQALAPLSQLGKGELSIVAGGLNITLRVLTSKELNYCVEYGKSGESEDVVLTDFIERYRATLLGYAICQIDNLNLRGEDYITNQGADGKMTRVPKHIAVRNLIEGSWSSTVTNSLFQAYSTLNTRVTIEAERQINYIPQDLDAEIERLTKRIAELNSEKEKNQVKPSDVLETLRDLSQRESELQQDPESVFEEPDPVPVPQPRTPISPKVAPPPSSSFGEINDASLQEEEARLAADRLAMIQEEPDFIAPPMGRRPPHVQPVGGLNEVRPSHMIDGKPAFDLPSEVISNRGKAVQPSGRPQVDPTPSSYNNPRFRKPNG